MAKQMGTELPLGIFDSAVATMAKKFMLLANVASAKHTPYFNRSHGYFLQLIKTTNSYSLLSNYPMNADGSNVAPEAGMPMVSRNHYVIITFPIPYIAESPSEQ